MADSDKKTQIGKQQTSSSASGSDKRSSRVTGRCGGVSGTMGEAAGVVAAGAATEDAGGVAATVLADAVRAGVEAAGCFVSTLAG